MALEKGSTPKTGAGTGGAGRTRGSSRGASAAPTMPVTPARPQHQTTSTPGPGTVGRVTRGSVAANLGSVQLEYTADPNRIGRTPKRTTNRASTPSRVPGNTGSPNSRQGSVTRNAATGGSKRATKLPPVAEAGEDDDDDNEDDDEEDDDDNDDDDLNDENVFQMQQPPTRNQNPPRQQARMPAAAGFDDDNDPDSESDAPIPDPFNIGRSPSHDSVAQADGDIPVPTIEGETVASGLYFAGGRRLSRSPSHTPSMHTARSGSRSSRGSSSRSEPDPNNPRRSIAAWHRRHSRSFWEVYWMEQLAGLRYWRGWWAICSGILACFLLLAVLCSAGPICKHHSVWTVLKHQLFAHPVETISLVLMYALMISGTGDVVMGSFEMARAFGNRIGRRRYVDGWANWRRMLRRLRRNLVLSCRDAFNLVAEPLLMLMLPLMLKWQCSLFTSGTLTCLLSLTLHVAKWLVQAIEVHWELQGRVAHLKWAAKPIVLCFLSLLAVVGAFMKWELMVLLMPQPMRAWVWANAFWVSEGYRVTGNRLFIGTRSWPTRAVSTPVYVVTTILIATGVIPTVTPVY